MGNLSRLRSDFYEKNCNGNATASGLDVDHMKELQVGGGDHCCSNLCPIPARANRSLGSQIKNAVEGIAEGTVLPQFQLGAPCTDPNHTKSCTDDYQTRDREARQVGLVQSRTAQQVLNGMRITLEIMDGPESGRKLWLLERQAIVVGRTQASEFSVPSDSQMSGIHFRLEWTVRGYVLRDLHSTNGTAVNGHRTRGLTAQHQGRSRGRAPDWTMSRVRIALVTL